MAKLFVESVRCPSCIHANDFDFRFCQRCGYKRKYVTKPVKNHHDLKLNIDEIEARLQQLLNFDQATSYKKQKDSLQKELEAFLSVLPGFVTMATVTPRVSVGNTPVAASYKTVDSYIGNY